ncbi:MAG: phosphopantetheine-binding protein, partial [Aurantibacter sp.]
DQNISSKELRRFLGQRLPSYMVPSVFKHLEEMPLTKNGKVDKTLLKNLNEAQLSMDVPFTAASGEIEVLLEEIWKEVLKIKKIGVHDNFIALGGHSLAAIRITARINEEVEIKLPLNKIFEFPTIAEYGKYIEETLTELLEN